MNEELNPNIDNFSNEDKEFENVLRPKLFNDFNWSPSIKLVDGLKTTYDWIYNQIISGENTKKFTKSY